MADRVLTISLRLTSLCGVVYAAVTASYISCFVWMGTLIASVLLIHPTSKVRIYSVSDAKIDTKKNNPLKGKPENVEADISDAIKYKINEDIATFVLYDATDVESLHHFMPVKNGTQCLFAKKAKLWGCQNWKIGNTLEENVCRSIPMFIKFTYVCQYLGLDGFLFELPGKDYAADILTFGQSIRVVMKLLSDYDPKAIHCMDKSYIEQPGWVFQFNRITFFVTTFAPFYPKTHSRYSFEQRMDTSFSSLKYHLPNTTSPDDTPHTNWAEPRTIRDQIRVAFNKAGRMYKIRQSLSYPMVHDILMPVHDSKNEIICWWKMDKQLAR